MKGTEFFTNTVGAIFKALAGLYKLTRGISYKDTPEQERSLFTMLMTWTVIIWICLIIAVVAGWDYVFKIL